MQAITPRSPMEDGAEMFQSTKTQSFFEQIRSSSVPPPQTTDEFDTDFEDDSVLGSDFEDDYSPKRSFESVSVTP